MSDYIKREQAAQEFLDWAAKRELFGSIEYAEALEKIPAADVVEVHAVIQRMNEERKRAKGNWHTDPYWLGWADAMRRAERIVDGTIDDEPMFAPSTGEKKEAEK